MKWNSSERALVAHTEYSFTLIPACAWPGLGFLKLRHFPLNCRVFSSLPYHRVFSKENALGGQTVFRNKLPRTIQYSATDNKKREWIVKMNELEREKIVWEALTWTVISGDKNSLQSLFWNDAAQHSDTPGPGRDLPQIIARKSCNNQDRRSNCSAWARDEVLCCFYTHAFPFWSRIFSRKHKFQAQRCARLLSRLQIARSVSVGPYFSVWYFSGWDLPLRVCPRDFNDVEAYGSL